MNGNRTENEQRVNTRNVEYKRIRGSVHRKTENAQAPLQKNY